MLLSSLFKGGTECSLITQTETNAYSSGTVFEAFTNEEKKRGKKKNKPTNKNPTGRMENKKEISAQG